MAHIHKKINGDDSGLDKQKGDGTHIHFDLEPANNDPNHTHIQITKGKRTGTPVAVDRKR